MSGETEANISGWTVDTLHVYLLSMLREKDVRDSQRFEAQQLAIRDALTAQEKAVNAALLAAQTAVAKAEAAAERRFESVNEFRAQLAEQARDLMPRKETEQMRDVLTEKIVSIENRINEQAGRTTGHQDVWGYVVGAIAAIVAVITIVIALKP